MDWLYEFMDAAGFVPRGCCGNWESAWLRGYIAFNIIITLSYLAIPFHLVIAFWAKRRAFDGSWVLLLGCSFVLLCGLGHAIENVGAFYWPNYRFFTVWHGLTAITSAATAIVMPPALFRAVFGKGVESCQQTTVL